ncbi:14-3-3 protein 7 [Tanacetum coccineum]
MVEAMNSVAKLGVELTAEERNLLSVGYKNVLGAKRASWRILSVIKSKEEANGEMQHVALAKESLKRVEDELTSKCNEILLTIDDYLLPSSKTGEAAVFYHKMKGDYYRYLAEIKSDAEREEATSQSLKAYEAATAIAETDLPPTNPIRLGVALNFSVFYYEIIANTESITPPHPIITNKLLIQRLPVAASDEACTQIALSCIAMVVCFCSSSLLLHL